nr:immunoglobulin heavy chain junction region [Macaca mulatta]MOX63639.1 immunoglobulin heavy chain junction region [Macaca mulatta]MOX63794.1 immunoglobulin heavy chain junction region [Macaca mulatta]MOX63835.1 immunoglobulin heavy chain junction region [Macaca mulatta]
CAKSRSSSLHWDFDFW